MVEKFSGRAVKTPRTLDFETRNNLVYDTDESFEELH